MPAAQQPNGRIDRIEDGHDKMSAEMSALRADVQNTNRLLWWVIGIMVPSVIGAATWATNSAVRQARYETRQESILKSVGDLENDVAHLDLKGEHRDEAIMELVRVTDRLAAQLERQQ